MNAQPLAAVHVDRRAGLSYGLLGLPLAFVALPLYVLLPNLYAREFGVPLAALGGALLAARLLDACVDPWIGRTADRLMGAGPVRLLVAASVCSALLGLGFAGLLLPPEAALSQPLAWMSVLLVVTYLGYSGVSVAHQSWGALLGGDGAQRSRVVAWREGFGVAGVVLASVAPLAMGLPGTVALLWVCLLIGVLAWTRAPRPPGSGGQAQGGAGQVWRNPGFRRLMAVFVVNGTASAIPATLVLFFVQDRLQAGPQVEAAALAVYFLSAALMLPLWLRGVPHWGLGRLWLLGMLLAVSGFVWAAGLGAGDWIGFLGVCVLTGIALGADLAMPGALLAGLIGREPGPSRGAGAYFGWWNFASKLNLALAAGLALPVLGWFGYAPGSRDPAALQTLTLAYCALPCALKLLAAGLLSAELRRNPAVWR